MVFGVIWERLVFLRFLYKIYGFWDGIVCFCEHAILEWVGILGHDGPVNLCKIRLILYV